ncbi:MAG: PRC-barrel domain-containing protein [Candidatus Marsarchaeota archaeon]|jgi:Uncharacterized conserved protein|nr:PRC-barrel domain-containing protein [Candidatus Marsarchaeota archaeon]
MPLLISELYGKQIITTSGNRIGRIEDVILDVEGGEISNLLMTKGDNLVRSGDTREIFVKNNIKFNRVKSISETVIIAGADTEHG